MEIIPAIDIIKGKVVRLSKGDFSKKIVYHDNPLDAAKSFEDAGLKRVHIVDLDGAKSGGIKNISILEAIASGTNLKIDFGGGIKRFEDVSNVFNAGASIITLGSIAVKQPQLIEEWIMEFGADKILVGADIFNEDVKINGWLKDGGITIFEFIRTMISAGVKNIFCTDISKDGMMKGPSVDLYKKIMKEFLEINLIASGGVSILNDVKELHKIGCKGIIIGKAIYEGKISLHELAELDEAE